MCTGVRTMSRACYGLLLRVCQATQDRPGELTLKHDVMNVRPRTCPSPGVTLLLAVLRRPSTVPWLAAVLGIVVSACAVDDLAPAGDTGDASAEMTLSTADGGGASARVCSTGPIRCL